MTDLLTVEGVARYLPLVDDDTAEAGSKAQILSDLLQALDTGDADADVLLVMYRTGYYVVAGLSEDPDQEPPHSLISETIAAHQEDGRGLREHFLAMGVINGLVAANPLLEGFAKLLILYSLGTNYADVLELIAFGPLPL